VAIKTTGELREILTSKLEKACNSELSEVDGRNIIGLANQITKSMVAEARHTNTPITVFGTLKIGKPKP